MQVDQSNDQGQEDSLADLSLCNARGAQVSEDEEVYEVSHFKPQHAFNISLFLHEFFADRFDSSMNWVQIGACSISTDLAIPCDRRLPSVFAINLSSAMGAL